MRDDLSAREPAIALDGLSHIATFYQPPSNEQIAVNLVLLHLVSIRVTISLELFRERFLNVRQLLGIDLGL